MDRSRRALQHRRGGEYSPVDWRLPRTRRPTLRRTAATTTGGSLGSSCCRRALGRPTAPIFGAGGGRVRCNTGKAVSARFCGVADRSRTATPPYLAGGFGNGACKPRLAKPFIESKVGRPVGSLESRQGFSTRPFRVRRGYISSRRHFKTSPSTSRAAKLCLIAGNRLGPAPRKTIVLGSMWGRRGARALDAMNTGHQGDRMHQPKLNRATLGACGVGC